MVGSVDPSHVGEQVAEQGLGLARISRLPGPDREVVASRERCGMFGTEDPDDVGEQVAEQVSGLGRLPGLQGPKCKVITRDEGVGVVGGVEAKTKLEFLACVFAGIGIAVKVGVRVGEGGGKAEAFVVGSVRGQGVLLVFQGQEIEKLVPLVAVDRSKSPVGGLVRRLGVGGEDASDRLRAMVRRRLGTFGAKRSDGRWCGIRTKRPRSARRTAPVRSSPGVRRFPRSSRGTGFISTSRRPTTVISERSK